MSSVTEPVKQVTCSTFNSLSLSKDNKLKKTFQLMILQQGLHRPQDVVLKYISLSALNIFA